MDLSIFRRDPLGHDRYQAGRGSGDQTAALAANVAAKAFVVVQLKAFALDSDLPAR